MNYYEKVLFVLVAIVSLSTIACGEMKTAEQAAKEDLEQMEKDRMSRERYIDSLVNIVTGYESTTLRANRQHALDILRKEYPQLKDKWNKVQMSIDRLELYSE